MTAYNIFRQDSDGNYWRLEPSEANLTRPRLVDELDARELELVLPRSTAIKEFDIVIVEKQGTIIFRGYVKFIEINDKREKTLTCAGMEDLLLHRFTPTYFIDEYDDITFGQLLGDLLVDGMFPGLIAQANSYLMPSQPYTVYDWDYDVISHPGLGTDSDIGTSEIFRLGDQAVVKLEENYDLDVMIANYDHDASLCYRDATTLYTLIGTNTGYHHYYESGGLFAQNWKDTTIRLGEMPASVSELDLDGVLLLDWTCIGDLIVSICAAHSLFVTVSDDWDHTYINVSDVEGRKPNTGVYTFWEDDLVAVSTQPRDEVRSTSITGRGQGLQYYTKDLHHVDDVIKVESVVEMSTEFKDEHGRLIDLVEDQFDDLNKSDTWTVEPASNDLVLYPSDWIKLKLDFEEETLAKIDRIEEDCLTGHMELELSEHHTDMSDVFEFMRDVDDGYQEPYPKESFPPTSGSVAFEDTSYINQWTTLDLSDHEDGAYDSDLDPMVTLTISLQRGDEGTDPIGKCTIFIEDLVGSWYWEIPAVPVDGSYTLPALDVTELAGADVKVKVVPVHTAAGTEYFNHSWGLTYLKRKEAV